MNAEVIDENLPLIRDDLISKGLSYEQLRDDILDHVCCMIEEGMDSGKDFESSYGEVLSSIEGNVLPELQHETLLLLDRKFQRMKRITYVLGLVGAILAISGAFFKMMHWPGASIIMTLGFMSVVLVFLPLYFILSYREQVEKPGIIFPIIAYLSLFFVFTGAVFKIMHWPGANIMLRTSIIVLLVGFLPLYIVQIFKRSSKSKVNPAYIIMLLVGISIVVILSRVNLSKDIIDEYTTLSIENTEFAELLEERCNTILISMGDELSPELTKIETMNSSLAQLISDMQEGLLEKVDQVGVPIQDVSRKDFRNAARGAISDSGLGVEFLSAASEYKAYLLSLVDDPIRKGQISTLLDFTSDFYVLKWRYEDYYNEALIIHYYYLSKFERAISECEYLAVQEIMHKSSD